MDTDLCTLQVTSRRLRKSLQKKGDCIGPEKGKKGQKPRQDPEGGWFKSRRDADLVAGVIEETYSVGPYPTVKGYATTLDDAMESVVKGLSNSPDMLHTLWMAYWSYTLITA